MTEYLYRKYYERTIYTALRGIKLVPGGTGLGKTGAIVDTVHEDTTERKYIYSTNRVQLLDEMEAGLRTAGVGYVHLRRDREILQRLLAESSARDAFYELLASPVVEQLSTQAQQRYQRPYDPYAIRRLCEDLRQVPPLTSDWLTELLESRVRQVMSFWKDLLRLASDNGRGEPTPVWRWLVERPIIRRLFPYLHFKQDATIRVLLVTIHKLYRGFFDGRKTVDIVRLDGDDGGRVIFLDEFDFLEGNLADLICEDTTIHAPFHFVEQFYRTMKHHRLPFEDYPVERAGLRGAIEAIIHRIERLEVEGIPFPNLLQFLYSGELREPPTLFQTNRSILGEPLVLEADARAMRLVPAERRDSEEGGVDALELLHLVHSVTYQILELFKELEVRDPIAYLELRRHAFANTLFEEQLGRVHPLPASRQGQPTGFGSLLASGYGMFELHHLQQETDPEEVEWRYFSLYTTPEAILASVAQHNLVFGLSATAMLPRYLGAFDLDWVGAQEQVTQHDITPADYDLIQTLNEQKQVMRGNRVRVEQAEDLRRTEAMQKQLLEFTRAIATEPDFGGDDSTGFRRRRLERFFRTLLEIADQPAEVRATSTHLLFYTSYRQIEHLFKKHAHPEDALWEVRESHHSSGHQPIFRYYEMDFAGAAFIIIFYNAERAQQLERDDVSQRHFNEAFWQGKPVVLITTYASAGNGVNLQYLPTPTSTEKEKTDFTAIHLLDSPHYYFAPLTDALSLQKRQATLKKNIWYLAKLHQGKLLSDERFLEFLKNIRQSGPLNRFYHQDVTTRRDVILNQMAIFVQALGRIEREWHAVPDQLVRIIPEVQEVLMRFSTDPLFDDVRARVWPLLSNNLQRVLEQMPGQKAAILKEQRRQRDERLPGLQQRSREAVAALLQRLSDMRAGVIDPDIRSTWQQLREAVLRHDFQHSLLQDHHLQTPYLQDGVLYLTSQGHLVPTNIQGVETRRWNLNAIYRVAAENQVIRKEFERCRYELAFRPGSQFIFSPYCYQAILAGAIGEEGIRALLQSVGVALTELPTPLFELADLKLRHHPWYIDCKHYSEWTLQGFSLPPTDPAWQPKLNDKAFKERARSKLADLRCFHAEAPDDCKLIYLNLASSEDRGIQYFDNTFQTVQRFDDASFIVVAGVLDWAQPNSFTKAFQRLVPFLT